MSRFSSTAQGIVLMVASIFLFSLMDVMIKSAAATVNPVVGIWARYSIQTVLVTLIILPKMPGVLKTRYPFLQALRSGFVVGATGLYFVSFAKLPLAQVAALMQIAPVIITLGAAVFLREHIGPRRAIGVAIALVGALIIIRPTPDGFTPWTLLPLGGALCYSAYVLATRFVGRDESVWTSLFYTALFATVVFSAAVPFWWQRLTAAEAGYLIAAGIFGTIAQLLLIRAFALAEASILAPMGYSGLIFAAVWSMVIFGEAPDMATYIGALVIVGAGLYVWQRERQATRAVTRQ